jgi:hypothetical protein
VLSRPARIEPERRTAARARQPVRRVMDSGARSADRRGFAQMVAAGGIGPRAVWIMGGRTSRTDHCNSMLTTASATRLDPAIQPAKESTFDGPPRRHPSIESARALSSAIRLRGSGDDEVTLAAEIDPARL